MPLCKQDILLNQKKTTVTQIKLCKDTIFCPTSKINRKESQLKKKHKNLKDKIKNADL